MTAQSLDSSIQEKPHAYGRFCHILKDAYLEAILAKFSQETCTQPEISRLVRKLSAGLLQAAVNSLFELKDQKVQTRMLKFHPQAEFSQALISPDQKAVVVDLMRAGILPSQEVFEGLHEVLPASQIRQDHILINRAVDQNERVTGVQLSGHKIGGSIQDAYVFIPDPMGATGGSLESVMKLYEGLNLGKPRKFLALHYIVTPEFLKRMKPYAHQLEIFCLRLDRGLSPADVLKKLPGEDWDRERGLNEKQYIVPGAGGVGELLNNSFV